MALVEVQREVTDDAAGRVDRIVQELTGRSRSDVRGLFDAGCVVLNGEACRESGTLVAAGDHVAVRHDPHMRYREKPRERASTAFRLVFEDEHLIVVDKAAAVLTVPTDRGQTNTLVDAVNAHLRRRNPRANAAVVHRLDRGTSGLLVFGKNAAIGRELQAQFRVRKAEREYAAIVAGVMEQPEGTFANRLATSKSLQRYSVKSRTAGEDAITHYRVERTFADATYVRLRLETGRRNQIRVHFAEAEHPVLGDDRYRSDLSQHVRWTARRLALHAAVLGFDHPRTREPLRFESPLPDEMQKFLSTRS